MALKLSKTEIKRRLWDLRNKIVLHAAAKQRISILEKVIKALKEKLTKTEKDRDDWKQRAEEVEKQVEEIKDVNKKLQSMLFEKYHGRNRSPTHADHHAKLMSVMETLRLENKSLLSNLQSILQRGIALKLSGG